MHQLTVKILLKKVVFVLCLIALSSIVLQAQVRTRTKNDSVQAFHNGYWYNPNNYAFEIPYPKLQVIPPLSSGMPFDILATYVYMDSLMRNTTDVQFGNQCYSYWEQHRTKNDTIIALIGAIYKLIDYDPVRFYQYMDNQGRMYTLNLNYLRGLTDQLIYWVNRTQNPFTMNVLNQADYILKVHINSFDYMPRPKDPSRGFYNVHATVLDSLKGKAWISCNNQTIAKKQSGDKMLITNNDICFTYVTGPYSNSETNFKVDSTLLDASGNMNLLPGSDVIVSLMTWGDKWDYNYDYHTLNLIEAMPIINGQVKDINHEWSNNLLLNYSDWKTIFLQKVGILINGGY